MKSRLRYFGTLPIMNTAATARNNSCSAWSLRGSCTLRLWRLELASAFLSRADSVLGNIMFGIIVKPIFGTYFCRKCLITIVSAIMCLHSRRYPPNMVLIVRAHARAQLVYLFLSLIHSLVEMSAACGRQNQVTCSPAGRTHL